MLKVNSAREAGNVGGAPQTESCFHSGGEGPAPAMYAESMVNCEGQGELKVFLMSDHRKGEMNGTLADGVHLGLSWFLCALEDKTLLGNGVSKTRYRQEQKSLEFLGTV